MTTARKRIGWLVFGSFLGLARVESAGAGDVWVPPTHLVPPSLTAFPWPVSGTGFASFGFAVPDDFGAYTSAKVVLIPKISLAGTFDVYGSVKRNGEAAGGGLLFNVAVPATLTAGTVQEVDVTALLAGQLEAASAGRDYVSVFFWFPASPGLEGATVLGLRFTYEAIRVQTAEIENGAITTSKLEAGAVTNAKLADNSVGPEKVVNNSLGSDEIANGSIGVVDVNRTEIQARVTGSCPVGQSIRAISASGDVLCQSLGLALVQTVNGRVECPVSSTYCSGAIACPAGRQVIGGGYEILNDGRDYVTLFSSKPLAGAMWQIEASNRDQFNAHSVAVFAICAVVPEAMNLEAKR